MSATQSASNARSPRDTIPTRPGPSIGATKTSAFTSATNSHRRTESRTYSASLITTPPASSGADRQVTEYTTQLGPANSVTLGPSWVDIVMCRAQFGTGSGGDRVHLVRTVARLAVADPSLVRPDPAAIAAPEVEPPRRRRSTHLSDLGSGSPAHSTTCPTSGFRCDSAAAALWASISCTQAATVPRAAPATAPRLRDRPPIEPKLKSGRELLLCLIRPGTEPLEPLDHHAPVVLDRAIYRRVPTLHIEGKDVSRMARSLPPRPRPPCFDLVPAARPTQFLSCVANGCGPAGFTSAFETGSSRAADIQAPTHYVDRPTSCC
jgi:hypothetical protein